tara:strand:- start:2344 stop:2550 length:207 start_codon:yes stop_codon:yes gene_type:complete
MRSIITKFMNNKWVKLIFSISIIISSVPSIIDDFNGGVNNGWHHYGTLFIGINYFLESTLWVIDLWKK